MDVLKAVRKRKWELVALILILTGGVFFRTYNFHSWMTFRDDQARDASIVARVVAGQDAWPLQGAFMSFSGDGDHNEEHSFHLGPMAYYFQIISAKMFGNYADKLAYPDALFNILAIPLLYLFLRIYFERSIALGCTGAFAFSSYFIQYSRFSWNTNLIPFFVLLFLFSLHGFLTENESVKWRWAVLLGFAVGVGIQLHAITMAIFLLLTLCSAVFSVKKGMGVWREWGLVLLVICIFNTSQIVYEVQTNFSNTKILFQSISQKSDVNIGKLGTLTMNDIDCHIEVNTYFLLSYGGDNCSHTYISLKSYSQKIANYKILGNLSALFVLLGSTAFSVLGYFSLVRYSRTENDRRKKSFLYLVLAYTVIAFLVLLPLSRDRISNFRYFLSIFFVAYVLLGLSIKGVCEKFPKTGKVFSGSLLLLFVYSNGMALYDQAWSLRAKNRTCSSHYTTLGELEPVAEYIAGESAGRQVVYFRGDQDLHVIYFPLAYLLKQHGIDSVEIGRSLERAQGESPAYLVGCRLGWREVFPYKAIDSFFVFRIDN
jgi:4-amino-4-deoxy-L-arabinose transferase-like glycosyltransferase